MVIEFMQLMNVIRKALVFGLAKNCPERCIVGHSTSRHPDCQ